MTRRANHNARHIMHRPRYCDPRVLRYVSFWKLTADDQSGHRPHPLDPMFESPYAIESGKEKGSDGKQLQGGAKGFFASFTSGLSSAGAYTRPRST